MDDPGRSSVRREGQPQACLSQIPGCSVLLSLPHPHLCRFLALTALRLSLGKDDCTWEPPPIPSLSPASYPRATTPGPCSQLHPPPPLSLPSWSKQGEVGWGSPGVGQPPTVLGSKCHLKETQPRALSFPGIFFGLNFKNEKKNIYIHLSFLRPGWQCDSFSHSCFYSRKLEQGAGGSALGVHLFLATVFWMTFQAPQTQKFRGSGLWGIGVICHLQQLWGGRREER